MGNSDPLAVLQLAVATAPLAIYLAFLGLIQLRSRPFVMTCRQDLFLLLAVLLPLPTVAVEVRSVAEHPLAAALAGGLLVVLTALLLPREAAGWVLYNVEPQDAERLVAASLEDLGEEADRSGGGFAVRSDGTRLSLSFNRLLSNAVVYHEGPRGRLHDRLARQFAARLPGMPPASPRAGLPFLAAAAGVLTPPAMSVFRHGEEIAALIKVIVADLLGIGR
jgi:hypothetical protein